MSKVRFTVGGSVIFHAVTWLRLNFTASYSLIVSSFFTVSLFGTPITSEPQKKRSENKNSGIFLAYSLSSVFVCYEIFFLFAYLILGP